MATDPTNQRVWRIEYDEPNERMYVMESTDSITYWRAFVLHPTLNKWGIFSDRIYGMLPLTNSQFGYVDQFGICNYFTPCFDRGAEPANSLGLDRHYPRFQKQLPVCSSSVVSRAIVPNGLIASEALEIPYPAWYAPGSLYPQPQAVKGMDAFIEIGYLKPDVGYRAPGDMNLFVANFIEIQVIQLGDVPSAPPLTPDFTSQWNYDVFYGMPAEDWSSVGTVVLGDVNEDFNTMTGTIDYSTTPNTGNYDNNSYGSQTISFVIDSAEDLNTSILPDEDWDGLTSGLPQIAPTVKLLASEDGITVATFLPLVARYDVANRTYTIISSGEYHSLRLEANNIGDYFHLRYGEVQWNYGGHQI